MTGTDTGIGKTTVAAALMHRLRAAGPVGYWKPVATGWPEDDDTATVRSLGCCSDEEIHDRGVRLGEPLSPWHAASNAGTPIDVAMIRAHAPDDPSRFFVVEGAGGLLVPLNERETIADLIGALALPAIVVARGGLGTINHTLLTIEGIRHRNIAVMGVIFVGEPNIANRAAIERISGVCILGAMPHMVLSESLSGWAAAELNTTSIETMMP